MRFFAVRLMIAGVCLCFAACQSSPSVHAAKEEATVPTRYGRGPIEGDLYSIDSTEKTIVIRVENGMAQTFLWDDSTVLDGDLPPDNPKKTNPSFDTRSLMMRLTRRPGSELHVEWRDSNGEKFATAIHVASLGNITAPKRNSRHTRKR